MADKPHMTASEADDLAAEYIGKEGTVSSTQEILDSGAVPKLKGFKVRPGKVSDCIFGGKAEYDTKAGEHVEFENPPLNTKAGLDFEDEGVPIRGLVRTTRISTHDRNRGSIPFKDQILAINHHMMLALVKGEIGSSQWDLGLGDNTVVIAAENLEQIPYENVLREYMAMSTTSTSLFMHYVMGGEKEFCGHKLPEGLVVNGLLPGGVMDTPSTKSDDHDISVSPQQLYEMGICTPETYAAIRDGSVLAFKKVGSVLRPKGIILADTKTEHGRNHRGEVRSQDELFTMDSSRFWLTKDWKHQMDLFLQGKLDELVAYIKETQPGTPEKKYMVKGSPVTCPISMSKEFARGFSVGEEEYTPDQRVKIAARYIEGIQHLTGKRFEPDMRPRDERVVTGLNTLVDKLAA